MPIVTPNSTIYFCNVPWDSTYKFICDGATNATILATSVAVQKSNYSYQRKDSKITVGYSVDELLGVNYVAYKNINHEDKRFYAFVESIEYINENRTDLIIRTDVYQTWRGDFTFGQSFVVREHVDTDTIGLHTVNEGLETGEYLKASVTTWTELNDLAVIVGVTQDSADPANDIAGRIYNGVFSGVGYVPFFGLNYDDTLRTFLAGYDATAKASAIVVIFTYPAALLPAAAVSGSLLAEDSIFSTYISKTVTINNVDIDGYTPKNKKLFSHPYNYLHASNLQGQSVDFQLEKFHGGYPGTVTFIAKGCMIPGARIACYTDDYKVNDKNSYEEVLTLANYPLSNWASDAWLNWIGQNALGVFSTGAASALSIGVGVATAQPLAIAGGAIGVISQLSTIYQKSIEPPSVNGNINNSTINIAMGIQHFAFYQVQITSEFAQIIDEFFTMFGYKINRVKTPLLAGRAQWNYLQTVDCMVKGGIPEEDRKQIQNIFNSGVTVWHNQANIGNYSLTNS